MVLESEIQTPQKPGIHSELKGRNPKTTGMEYEINEVALQIYQPSLMTLFEFKKYLDYRSDSFAQG
jgi:hypothetical protein